MTVRLLALAWLVAVWVALWGSLTIGNVLGGLLVGGTLLAAFPVRDAVPASLYLRPLQTLRLLGIFIRDLVGANVVVAREVLSPGAKEVNEGVIAVPATDASTLVLSVLAAMISLTPGTLIIELQPAPAVLYVHVFHLHTVEEARLDILRTERAVIRALGSPTCLHTVERRIAELEDAAFQKAAR